MKMLLRPGHPSKTKRMTIDNGGEGTLGSCIYMYMLHRIATQMIIWYMHMFAISLLEVLSSKAMSFKSPPK